jgi:hypothetical protein
MNAIFSVAYTGQSGRGLAVLVFLQGTIAGADMAGGIYDGTYHLTDDGGLLGKVRMKIPAGVPLVTGTKPATEPYAVDFEISLPSDMGGEKPVLLTLPVGKVNQRPVDHSGGGGYIGFCTAACATFV